MYSPVFFDAILIERPLKRIYRRLGYREGVTTLETEEISETEGYVSEALSVISLRGVGLRCRLAGKKDDSVSLEGKDGIEVLRSRRLARFLEGCHEVVLMGATAGNEVMKAIEEDVRRDRLTRGVVFDAVASEMVDAALDWIMSYFARELRRENRMLTDRRFSAGYGDFTLENQGIMFRLLKMHRLGVRIMPSFVLAPEKSVTALAGVKGVSIEREK